MVQIEDPVTGTEWVDSEDPSGSVMQSLMALLGIGIFVAMFSVASASVAPVIEDIATMVPGLQSGESSGIRVGD